MLCEYIYVTFVLVSFVISHHPALQRREFSSGIMVSFGLHVHTWCSCSRSFFYFQDNFIVLILIIFIILIRIIINPSNKIKNIYLTQMLLKYICKAWQIVL